MYGTFNTVTMWSHYTLNDLGSASSDLDSASRRSRCSRFSFASFRPGESRHSDLAHRPRRPRRSSQAGFSCITTTPSFASGTLMEKYGNIRCAKDTFSPRQRINVDGNWRWVWQLVQHSMWDRAKVSQVQERLNSSLYLNINSSKPKWIKVILEIS